MFSKFDCRKIVPSDIKANSKKNSKVLKKMGSWVVIFLSKKSLIRVRIRKRFLGNTLPRMAKSLDVWGPERDLRKLAPGLHRGLTSGPDRHPYALQSKIGCQQISHMNTQDFRIRYSDVTENISLMLIALGGMFFKEHKKRLDKFRKAVHNCNPVFVFILWLFQSHKSQAKSMCLSSKTSLQKQQKKVPMSAFQLTHSTTPLNLNSNLLSSNPRPNSKTPTQVPSRIHDNSGSYFFVYSWCSTYLSDNRKNVKTTGKKT